MQAKSDCVTAQVIDFAAAKRAAAKTTQKPKRSRAKRLSAKHPPRSLSMANRLRLDHVRQAAKAWL